MSNLYPRHTQKDIDKRRIYKTSIRYLSDVRCRLGMKQVSTYHIFFSKILMKVFFLKLLRPAWDRCMFSLTPVSRNCKKFQTLAVGKILGLKIHKKQEVALKRLVFFKNTEIDDKTWKHISGKSILSSLTWLLSPQSFTPWNMSTKFRRGRR